MMNMVLEINSVGVPLRTPVELDRERPVGRAGLAGSRAQDTMAPRPLMVGDNGRSLEAVLLVMLKSFGE